MATSLEKSKKLNEVIKPLHLSNNPEILVKIAPLVSELRGLESLPLKKIKKYRKNIGKIYSPSSKFAERAKLAWCTHFLCNILWRPGRFFANFCSIYFTAADAGCSRCNEMSRLLV